MVQKSDTRLNGLKSTFLFISCSVETKKEEKKSNCVYEMFRFMASSDVAGKSIVMVMLNSTLADKNQTIKITNVIEIFVWE